MVFSWSREKELHFIVFYQSSLLLKLLGTQWQGHRSNDRIGFWALYVPCTRWGWEKGMNTRTIAKIWAQRKMAVVPMELVCSGIVNFLHCSWYEAAFWIWICAEHSVYNTGMILSLLRKACTESRPFLFLVPSPTRRLRGHNWAGWPQPWHCAWHIKLGEGEGRKQGTFRVMAFLF